MKPSLQNLFILAVMSCLVIGCLRSRNLSDGNEEVAIQSNESAGLTAFKNGFYAFAHAQNCVKCHGTSKSPYFAAADVTQAYIDARPHLDLYNPTNSQFVKYVSNGHCNDAPCSAPEAAETVRTLMVEWAQVEIAAGAVADQTANLPRYLTATVPLPATIPAATTAPAVVRFMLNQLNITIPRLSNAVLEVEIQMLNPDMYRIRRPKIVGITAPLTITNMHVFIRPSNAFGVGSEDTDHGNLWNTQSGIAAAANRPNPLPNGPFNNVTPFFTTALSVQKQSSADVITVGFDDLL